mgnify:CR=1 FL=1
MKFERKVSASPSVDLTPMLDVVFLLLIFFMVSTRFDSVREVPIALPQVGAGTSVQKNTNQRVQIQADGALFLDGSEVKEADLEGRLRTTKRVVLSADKAVSHGVFMNVLTRLRALPLESVTVEVEAQ